MNFVLLIKSNMLFLPFQEQNEIDSNHIQTISN